jgi:hypothetical protein
MKYMLLIYNNPDVMDAMSDDERNATMNKAGEIMEELTKSGELVGGEALAHPSNTKTVRLVNGAVSATDGPFVEAKELLAGFITVEVDSVERAIEIAARWPDAEYGAMEVRPLMDTSGMEM